MNQNTRKGFRISFSFWSHIIHRLSDLRFFFLCDLDIQRPDVFLEVSQVRRSGDRDDIVSLRHEPCQRELAGSTAAMFLGDGQEPVGEIEVFVEIFGAETGRQGAEVAFGEVLGALISAGEKASAERGIGDDGDAEFARGLQDVELFDLERPGAVFHLDRVDVFDRTGSSQRVGGTFADAEMFDFALLLQLGHGLDGDLDRLVLVDSVAVVKVDIVSPQSLEAVVATFFDIFGVVVDGHSTKFRRKKDLTSLA